MPDACVDEGSDGFDTGMEGKGEQEEGGDDGEEGE